MKKQLFVVDEDGEILDTISDEEKYVKLSTGDRVIRNGTTKYLSDTIDLKYYFVKINSNIFDMYCKKYSILPSLVCNIGYMTNICEFRNGKKLNMRNITRLCNVSESTVRRQIKGMLKDDLLHIVKDGRKKYFVMNPFLCMLGKRIDLSLYEEFKSSSLRKYCEERNI